MPQLDIGTVIKHSGLAASTLRYYEEKGLIRSSGRRGLRRQYDAGVLERLALIALGRSAGFPLTDIAAMLSAEGQPRIDRKQLLAKAEELDNNIQQLTAARDGLRHAAMCKAPSHMECSSFKRLLRIAANGRFKPLQQIKNTTR